MITAQEYVARVDEFYERSISGHGYWLINHRDIIEDHIASAVRIYGVATTLELMSNRETAFFKKVYGKIEEART